MASPPKRSKTADDGRDPKTATGSARPQAWLFYATPERSKGAWRRSMRPGQIIFWQHGLAEYSVGGAPHSRVMRKGDTVIVVTGDEIAATAVLAADNDLRFKGEGNSRWWPLLMVDVLDKPIPRALVEQRLKRNLIGSRGAVHPLHREAFEAIAAELRNRSGFARRTLPFSPAFVAGQMARGQSLEQGLTSRPDIHPDAVTAEMIEAEGELPSRPDPLPTVFNDRADAEDLLSIDPEVTAFARLAISRGIDPPLSIGIFGDWGSGKSFFMERIKRKIDDLAGEAVQPDHPSHGALYGRVPQIRFNAWHYIETNLWASLVEFIFAELDRWLRQHDVPVDEVNALFDRLATSRQLKLEAYAELIRATKEEAEAQAKLAEAQAVHRKAVRAPLSGGDLWSAAAKAFIGGLGDEDKAQLKAAASTIGIDDLDASGQAAAELVRDTAGQAGRARLVVESIVDQVGSVQGALLITASLVGPAAVVVLIGALSEVKTAATLQHLITASAVSLGALTFMGGRALAFARTRLKTLDKLRISLSATVLEKTRAEREAAAKAEATAEHAAQAVAEAERRAQEASSHVAALLREQDNVSASGRLNRFIRDKVTNGDYARHLGIVASVHKDFAQLSALLHEQNLDSGEAAREAMEKASQAYRKVAEALIKDAKVGGAPLNSAQVADLLEAGPAARPAPRIDRIVLYIDDLDRCPPDKVIDVLQAIHMLLFFPLFVVLVAVDARWLRRSLSERYRGLIDSSGADVEAAPGGERVADAQDYLEKIFQIPFRVNPMTRAQGGNFVSGLTKGLVQLVPPSDEDPYGDDAGTGSGSLSDEEFDALEALEGDGEAWGASELVEISLTAEEQTALTVFGALLGGSPRRTKRFVNTYLLIRIGRQLSGDTEPPEQAVWMIAPMLAVVVGVRGAKSEAFFAAVAEPKTLLSSANQFKTRVLSAVTGADGKLLELIVLEMVTRADSFDPRKLIQYAPLVQRYAF